MRELIADRQLFGKEMQDEIEDTIDNISKDDPQRDELLSVLKEYLNLLNELVVENVYEILKIKQAQQAL